MNIKERAELIPSEALTNHRMNNEPVKLTKKDVSDAYIAGARDVINLISDIIKIELIQAEIDMRNPDYKGVVLDINDELEKLTK